MDPSPDAPAPRLCHLVKWPDFDGYGFNLHAEKNKPGQFIGKVDEKSPAQAAGLHSGDRIIEVNNVNIANENHKQVVERIKAVPGETKLLVVDDSADKYYKERKMVVKHTMTNVVHIKTPASKKEFEANLANKEERPITPVTPQRDEQTPTAVNNAQESPNEKMANGSAEESIQEKKADRKTEEIKTVEAKIESPILVNKKEELMSVKQSPKVEVALKESPKVEVPVKESPKLQKDILQAPKASPKPSPKASPKPSPQPDANGRSKLEENRSSSGDKISTSVNGSLGAQANGQGNLNLNMSAQEMRELIASRSKNRFDPKKESMDLKKKYAIIQSM